MEPRDVLRRALSCSAFIAALAGCAASQLPVAGPSRDLTNSSHRPRPAHLQSPIGHIIFLVQEGRTYNDLFAGYPGGDGTISGKAAKDAACGIFKNEMIPLSETRLRISSPLSTRYKAFVTASRRGFDRIVGSNGKPECRAPYQYVNPADITPYWSMAAHYALADHMFQTQGSSDFTAHQDLIRGNTAISATRSVIDSPNGTLWGCQAPAGTTTNVITTQLKYLANQGPFPCFSYTTLQTLLDPAKVSWKYYAPGPDGPGDPFFAIAAVWNNRQERDAHISSPETNVLRDIANGTLPAMSWVAPSLDNSDAPGSQADDGPAWVASVVNAVGESSYWSSSAIVIVWDDWGGLYDPVAPPQRDDQGGPGFRVPMIVISPYAPDGEVAHSVYGFGSIIRFIEDTWALGRLGTTDRTETSIGNIFDFKQSPRSFTPIASR